MTTLAEAIAEGQGVERPFRCHMHDDGQASASVNVLKGLWYCYACHASGTVDEKAVPTTDQLFSMLEPDKSARRYPESYLDLFDNDDYWGQRFPDWLCWYARLGTDPFTGDATFPVRTPSGYLAGVGRRREQEEPRYKYPWGWSASTVLGGLDQLPAFPYLVLTEGYADAVSLWEVGVPAACTFGAGLHLPQLEMVYRRDLRCVLTGYDMDKAGATATVRSVAALRPVIDQVARIEWPAKDPAECAPADRLAAVLSVTPSDYAAQRLEWLAAMRSQHATLVKETA